MMRKKHFWLSAAAWVSLLLLVAGCGGTGAGNIPARDAAQDSPAVVGDEDLSYRNTPLESAAVTPAVQPVATEPGDSRTVPRSFENAPPVIPHTVEGLLPITAADNQCTECHLPDMAEDAGAPSIPASHMYDIRRDRKLTSLNPANYNCTQCHAMQTDAGELVANSFTPDFRSDKGMKESDLLERLNEGVR